MKNKYLLLGGLSLLTIIISSCSGASAASPKAAMADNNSQQEPRTLSVGGRGSVSLTPDIAYINIGVHSEGKDAAEAVSENNVLTQNVIETLKDSGVDDKDIKTTNFSIYPQQEYDREGQPSGEINYRVDNSVFVTVRDLDSIGNLLDATVKAGANSINGIQFDVEDRSEALSLAREDAVNNARSAAEELAQAAGVTLGEIQSISVFGAPAPSPFEGRGGAVMMADASVPVSPGQMEVTIEVNIVYEIQ